MATGTMGLWSYGTMTHHIHYGITRKKVRYSKILKRGISTSLFVFLNPPRSLVETCYKGKLETWKIYRYIQSIFIRGVLYYENLREFLGVGAWRGHRGWVADNCWRGAAKWRFNRIFWLFLWHVVGRVFIKPMEREPSTPQNQQRGWGMESRFWRSRPSTPKFVEVHYPNQRRCPNSGSKT